MTAVFTAADIAELKALNDAHLPHTAKLFRGARTSEPGGTGSYIAWEPDPLWEEPARISPSSAPQEQLSAGSITNVDDVWLVTREGVSIPRNTGTTYYKINFEHDLTGVTNPLPLSLRGQPFRSYRALSKFLMTTVMPK
jgi:hypothetical protein